MCGKKSWVTFWDENVDPRAHEAQRNYLKAEQHSIDLRKDWILLSEMKETANEMRRVVEATQADLESWVVHLATGKKVSEENADGEQEIKEIKSLYHSVVREISNIEVNHQLDKDLEKVGKVIGEHTYETQIGFVEQCLSKLNWLVKEQTQKIKLIDGSELSKLTGLDINLETKHNSETMVFNNSGITAINDNLAIMKELAGEPYSLLESDHPFAVEIQKQTDTNTGDKLAKMVFGKADPFWLKTSTGVGPLRDPLPRLAMIRVVHKEGEKELKYFSDFRKSLQELDPTVSVSDIIDSQDPYKMTIVRFDDIIKSEDFDVWERCREAYISITNNPGKDLTGGDLHIFKSEINACEYEKEISIKLKKDYRILNPKLVALMDDKERIEMFFRCLAFGFIKKKQDASGNTYWGYQINKEKEVYLSLPERGFSGTGKDVEKEYRNLINQFVSKAYDAREGYKDTSWIDFEELEIEISNNLNKLSNEKIKNLYREQITFEDGMISNLRNEITRQRSMEKDAQRRKKIALELEDMADLAETIYKIAAERER